MLNSCKEIKETFYPRVKVNPLLIQVDSLKVVNVELTHKRNVLFFDMMINEEKVSSEIRGNVFVNKLIWKNRCSWGDSSKYPDCMTTRTILKNGYSKSVIDDFVGATFYKKNNCVFDGPHGGFIFVENDAFFDENGSCKDTVYIDRWDGR